ncbi:fucolectin-like [Aquarana catesbeiana]|uniref:fucolectin-like n=1 Tax=Aquarana catesbeiana TaxID=8400 RepID=UPI003CC9DF35
MVTDSLCLGVSSRMKTLVGLLFLGSLGLAWCCDVPPGATNIARSGEASQSSDYPIQPIGYAKKAIDGVIDTDWYHGFCTHTNQDPSPWWKVDLKQKYKVNVVVVTGRTDGSMGRMMGAEVRIGNSPDNNNPVCGKVTQVSDPKTIFCCNGMEGQYVSVVIPGRTEFLHLCEVEVYSDVVAQENHVCW